MEEKIALRTMTDAELQAAARDMKVLLKDVQEELKRRNAEIVQRIAPPPNVRDGEKQRG